MGEIKHADRGILALFFKAQIGWLTLFAILHVANLTALTLEQTPGTSSCVNLIKINGKYFKSTVGSTCRRVSSGYARMLPNCFWITAEKAAFCYKNSNNSKNHKEGNEKIDGWRSSQKKVHIQCLFIYIYTEIMNIVNAVRKFYYI